MHNNRARLSIIAAMAIWGTIGLFVRAISVSSAELALYRAVIAAILLSGYFLISKTRIDLKKIGKELPLLLLSGMAMGVNWILLFEAYKYTTVSVATLSYYFAPVIVMLACPVLFGEKLTLKQVLCFVFSTIGLVLVINVSGLSEGSNHLKGVIFGLIAAAMYACVMLMNKKIQKVSGIDRTLLQFGAAIIVLVPYIMLTEGLSFAGMDAKGWMCLFAVGFVHSCLAYCMYFSALRNISGQEAAILSYIDPLVAVVISFTVLKETVAPIQLVGGAMILAFTLLNELKVDPFAKKK
jgi:drug/metabolite transporter (DMT)-like permease